MVVRPRKSNDVMTAFRLTLKFSKVTHTRMKSVVNSTIHCIRHNPVSSSYVMSLTICPSTSTVYQRTRRQVFPLFPRHRRFSTSIVYHIPNISQTQTPQFPWPTTTNPTPYEIFHLPRIATQKEIKTRYFQLVKQYHPDQAHGSRATVTYFHKVVDAYKILSHPLKRREWDENHPVAHDRPQAGIRRPWSGSRLSRRRTEPKGPPPSGGWSFRTQGPRIRISHDYSGTTTDADNEHFSYEKHYRRNLEQEMRIKKRLDELHKHKMEYERLKKQNRSNTRIGLMFTG